MPRLVPLLLVALAAAFVTGCSSQSTPKASSAFCDAVDKFNTLLDHQRANGQIPPTGKAAQKQIDRVQAMVRTAPRAIKGDAQTFLDALERAHADDQTVKKDDPGVRAATDNVNRYANKACGLYSGGEGF